MSTPPTTNTLDGVWSSLPFLLHITLKKRVQEICISDILYCTSSFSTSFWHQIEQSSIPHSPGLRELGTVTEERCSRFTNRLFCDGGLQDLFLAV